MLVLILLSTALILGAGGEIYQNENVDVINSHIHFANRMQEYLNGNQSRWVPSQCSKELLRYASSLLSTKPDTMWAKQMFDAGAKLPSGLFEGNMADLGSFDECINIDVDFPPSSNILGQYCIIVVSNKQSLPGINEHFLANSPIFTLANNKSRSAIPLGPIGLQLATCLPSVCRADQIQQLYSELLSSFAVLVPESLCQTKGSEPELDGGSIATISVFGIILSIMLASTVYDAFLQYLGKDSLHPMLIAFSVLTNGKKLLATSKTPSQISCIHGIRVITTMWVILGHRYSIQSSFPMRNLVEMMNMMMDQANMFILGATISVDTFFLMSGLLISYSYIAAVTKGVKFNIIIYYIHRYLRLTPILAAVIVIHATLVRHFGNGPLWPTTVHRDIIDGCETNWWKALLYAQNIAPEGKECITQSWYLNIDMQLFILSPILLIPLKRWPKYSLIATGILTACSILTCFLTAWFYKFNHNMAGNQLDNRMKFSRYYYTAIQTRAAPWLIGIIAGYAIYAAKRNEKMLNINKVLMLILWITSLAVLCTCVFSGHDLIFGEYDRLANSVHIALVRPAWAVALSFIIFACVIGYGGPVNWFLSLPVFEVVSRLTYAQYLTHFSIIVMQAAQMRTTLKISHAYLLYIFWGDYALTLLISFILTLAFESPVVAIEKVLFGKRAKQETKRPHLEGKPAENA